MSSVASKSALKKRSHSLIPLPRRKQIHVPSILFYKELPFLLTLVIESLSNTHTRSRTKPTPSPVRQAQCTQRTHNVLWPDTWAVTKALHILPHLDSLIPRWEFHTGVLRFMLSHAWKVVGFRATVGPRRAVLYSRYTPRYRGHEWNQGNAQVIQG